MALRQERTQAAEKMAALLDMAEDEKRGLTAAEKTEFERLDAVIDRTNLALGLTDKDYRSIKENKNKIINPIPRNGRGGKNTMGNDSEEFRNVGEQLYSLVQFKQTGRMDPRLDKAYRDAEEMRAMSMGTGSEGGFALPEQFSPQVRGVASQEAVIRPRATVIPAGFPPDAQLSLPVLDQGSSSNMTGGVSIVHTGEAITMTETSAALKEVMLEPKEMSAYIVVTNKLLANWESGGAVIGNLLTQAMNGQEDYDFLRGDGINKALGITNSPCVINYTRAGAAAIAYGDIVGMMARLLMRGPGNFVWVGSQTTLPQLASLVTPGNFPVWLGLAPGGTVASASGPLPSTLLGVPLVFSDRLPVLGTRGDLMLINPSFYLIKDGSGPFVASSEHIYFLSNRTVFKIVWNVDAKPWLDQALQLEGAGAGVTVSPFVILS